MAYSCCIGQGQVQGTGLGLMGPNILYRNVHTGPRQGQEPNPFSPIVPVPFPVPAPVPVPVPRRVNKPLDHIYKCSV